jgi:hypothetical protein
MELPLSQTAAPIWEWQQDSGWEKYDAYTSGLIDSAYNSNTLTLHLTHGYFGESGGYTINLTHMVQVRDSSGNERAIRRIPHAPPLGSVATDELAEYEDEGTIGEFEEDLFQPLPDPQLIPPATTSLPTTTNTAEKAVWEWFNDSTWNPYDQDTNNIIEEAYSNKVPTVALSHGFFGDSGGYTIDFTNMNQIRDTTGYARQIRRTPPAIPIPGANLSRPPKSRQKLPPRNTETIHCDPAIMNELQTALHLLSNKPNDVLEEVPVQEIFVED